MNKQLELLKQDQDGQKQNQKAADLRSMNKLNLIRWEDLKVQVGAINEKEIGKRKARAMKKLEKKLDKAIYNLISDSQSAYTCKNSSYFHVSFEITSGPIHVRAYSI